MRGVVMTSKQELARLTLASVALLLAGLLTTPLIGGERSIPQKTALEHNPNAADDSQVLRLKKLATRKNHNSKQRSLALADNRTRR